MAFFRMKLHGEYVLACHRRGEPYAVLGRSCDIDWLSRIDIVAMHKIEPGVLVNALPQRMQGTLGQRNRSSVRWRLRTLPLAEPTYFTRVEPGSKLVML